MEGISWRANRAAKEDDVLHNQSGTSRRRSPLRSRHQASIPPGPLGLERERTANDARGNACTRAAVERRRVRGGDTRFGRTSYLRSKPPEARRPIRPQDSAPCADGGRRYERFEAAA